MSSKSSCGHALHFSLLSVPTPVFLRISSYSEPRVNMAAYARQNSAGFINRIQNVAIVGVRPLFKLPYSHSSHVFR